MMIRFPYQDQNQKPESGSDLKKGESELKNSESGSAELGTLSEYPNNTS